MTKKLTHEEFINKIKIKAPEIQILSTYNKAKEPILVKCNKCGTTFTTTPNNLLSARNSGCNTCAIVDNHNKSRKSQQQFVDEVLIIHPNIEVLGTYVNNKTKIKCKCKLHNTEFEVTPNSLLSSQYPCPVCRKLHLSNSQFKNEDLFLSQVKEIHPNIQILDTYKGSFVKLKCQCTTCNNIWETTPDNLINSRAGCPNCHLKSKGEEIIKNILDNLGIKYMREFKIKDSIFSNRKFIKVDFKLEYNSKIYFIEYNGIQHYQPVYAFGGELSYNSQKIRDNDLKKYCIKYNISLIEIPYKYNKIDDISTLIKNFINYES